MNQFKALCWIFLLIVMISIPCNAVPEITSWSNTATSDDDLNPYIGYDENINFTVVANETIVTWSWYVDEVNQSNNVDYLNDTFTTPGYVNVTCYGTNANGTSDAVTWIMWVGREVAAATIAESTKQNTSAFDDMLSAFDSGADNPIGTFVGASFSPYTDLIGAAFYLVLFGVSIIMQWNGQSNILMPTVVVLTLSGLIFGLLPEDWKLYAALMVIIGGASTLWVLYKDRG